jgi:hypothetical protein
MIFGAIFQRVRPYQSNQHEKYISFAFLLLPFFDMAFCLHNGRLILH